MDSIAYGNLTQQGSAIKGSLTDAIALIDVAISLLEEQGETLAAAHASTARDIAARSLSLEHYL